MSTKRIPDLHGQVIVITGGNSGIGKEAAVALASMGATVIITARNQAKGQAALADVRQRSGSSTVELMDLDLADFASIRAFAAELLERFDRLDVLVNNAGGIISDQLHTAQGFEMTFGVNHLGHFLLTELLLDRLVQSAPSRVITVASIGHRFAMSGLSFDDLQSDLGYSSMDAYAKSKLANIMFSNELARRLEGTGVTSNSLHPGGVRSGFGKSDHNRGIDRIAMVVGAPFLRSAKGGAKTTVYLASSPDVAGATGGYYVRRKLHTPSKRARDAAAAGRLWEESESLVAKAGA
jgi:NAD(P)-dependent dehydrogenase (short-subunit alcohol dehydrogenase family)